MTKPDVSIILPFSNDQEYITIAIDSVLRQSLTNIELIVVSYGSMDSSLSIIRHYKDKRLKILQTTASNYYEALNSGLSASTGRYITRMGASDISHPDRLETIAKYLDTNNEVGLVASGFEYIDEDGLIYAHSLDLDRNTELHLALLLWNPFNSNTLLIRKKLVSNYLDSSKDPERDFLKKLSQNGARFAMIHESLYAQRKADKTELSPQKAAVSRAYWRNVLNISKDDVLDAIKHYGELGDEYLDQYAYLLASVILAARKNGRYILSSKILLNVLSVPGLRHRLKGALKNVSAYNHNPLETR
jgi:glycosyltransferase involved in cell wall biosynthesis